MNFHAFFASLIGAVVFFWAVPKQFGHLQTVNPWISIILIIGYSLLGSWIGEKFSESAYKNKMYGFLIGAFLLPAIIFLVVEGAQ